MSSLRPHVKHRVWVFSDLQQTEPADALRCLTAAVGDFRDLRLPCDQMWYLGDAVQGADLERVREMCRMQTDLLVPLGIPLRYVVGNHDLDHLRAQEPPCIPVVPFRETVGAISNWKSTEALGSFFFLDDLGEFLIVFLPDHVAPDGTWHTTNGAVRGDTEAYPYGDEDWRELRERIEAAGRPVITVSHYAFRGGNRPSALLDGLLPIPANVKVHFYGHAHIGDAVFVGEDRFRKISWTCDHNLPQIDVASLEDRRGNEIRSVFLEIYDDRSLGIYFRDHGSGRWAEALLLSDER